MNDIKRKKIVIRDNRTIFPLGGVTGPIESPFYVDITTLFHLMITKHDVAEVLEDGTKIKLNINNYDKDNSHRIKKQDVVREQPKVESKPVVEDVVDEHVEEKPQEHRNKNFNNNGKNNNNQQKNK